MMKKNIIRTATGFLAALSLTISGCSNFLDVNENPNKPTSADPNLILPSTQAEIALVLGNHFQVYGGIWSQYWTQNFGNSQFKSVEQYLVQASDFDRPWQTLYADAMTDAQLVINLSGQERYRQYAAISMILKAYDLQLATDAWGDVPYKDALKGVSDEITSPHYDKQEEIYDNIFAMIDTAKAWIEPGSDFLPGAEDLIFGGDMDQWTRFANTLKLRAYLRLAYVAPQKAQEGIEALEAEGAEFLEESAQIVYGTTGGNNNPLYAELFALGQYRQLRASNTLFKQMQSRNDPRIDVYFQLISGVRRGMDQASYDVGPNGSTPAPIFGADPLNTDAATAPVKFISSYESYFLQAEAALTLGKTGDAEALLLQGIQASFDKVAAFPASINYSPTSDTTFLITPTKVQKYLTYVKNQYEAAASDDAKLNIIEKEFYIAAWGNGLEPYNTYRRTAKPDNFQLTANVADPGAFIRSFFYPAVYVNLNKNITQKTVTNVKVFWDTNPDNLYH